MSKFGEFIGRRFGCIDELDTNEKHNSTKPAPTASEDTSISDTPANRAFMTRFCKVN